MTIASSAVHSRMQNERIIETGSYLPKLAQKDCGVLFWLTAGQEDTV